MVTRKTTRSASAKADSTGNALIADIRRLVADARAHVVSTANATLTLLYWRIGRRIHADVLAGDRAAYGEQIVVTLSRQLEAEYGSSFSEKNLRRMIQLAQVFPDEKIVVSLIRELSWTHFLALLPLKEPLQRKFYAEMCRAHRWRVRVPCGTRSAACSTSAWRCRASQPIWRAWSSPRCATKTASPPIWCCAIPIFSISWV